LADCWFLNFSGKILRGLRNNFQLLHLASRRLRVAARCDKGFHVDKRFVTFLMLTMLVMLGYLQIRTFLAPPPPNEEVAAPNAIDAEPTEPDGSGEEERPTPDGTPGDDPPVEMGARDPNASQQQWVTLGSIDPQSPYRLLVTFNSRGAAVERAELSSRQFLDLEDAHGYLGHLALTDGESGAKINVVGPGTPAANAKCKQGNRKGGLQVGDEILAINGTKLEQSELLGYADHFRQLLAQTRAGQTITLELIAAPGADLLEEATSSDPLTYTAELIRPPMSVIRPEAMNIGQRVEMLERQLLTTPVEKWQPLSFLTSLAQVGGSRLGAPTSGFTSGELDDLPSMFDGQWELIESASPDEVAFRFTVDEAAMKKIGEAGKLEVIKRYRLAQIDPQLNPAVDPSYHLTMTLEVRNLGDEDTIVALQQQGATGLPLEGWWYIRKGSPDWGGAGMRDVVWRSQDGPNKLHRLPVIVDEALDNKTVPLFANNPPPVMRYVGVDGPYFSAVMLPDEDAPTFSSEKFQFQYGETLVTSDIEKRIKQVTGVSYRLITAPQQIKPGKSFVQSFTVFIGPKQPEVLAAYGLEDTIEFGWTPFAEVGRIMAWLLHKLYFVTFNYGIAIILLTMMVRLAVLPIGRKQAQNAAKMQELAPEMKALAEKYKDMEQRAKAQQELFKRHNYNPLGGCWMMFLQLPIFIGLYKALSVSIDLRQAPLIPGISWASNLAGPDMLIRWDTIFGETLAGPGGILWFLTGPNGYLGPFLNLLPLVTIGLFIVHQKLFTPPPTDEQQQLQQKMMSFMMIFMGFLFFKVPSGLCIYFITSSLWGIGERKLLPKAKAKPSPLPPDEKPATKSTDNKSKEGVAATTTSAVKGWLESVVRAADKPNGAGSSGSGKQDRDEKRRKRKKK
jgi:YidC/Oxa1 family membrane protein insertase